MRQTETSKDRSHFPHFKIRMQSLLLSLTIVLIGACTSLSHKTVSLDGSSFDNLNKVATINVENSNPLLIRGLDGELLDSVKLQTEFRTWSFAVSPGHHILWLSSTPYGHPLLPQRHRCYSMEVFLSPGGKYILREIPGEKRAQLFPRAGGAPVANGLLVDNPWVFESGCRWK